MEEKQLYAVDRLEQAKRTILLAKEEMPAARKKIEKQLQKDPNGAKDWYQTLRSQQGRLLPPWRTAAFPCWRWSCPTWLPPPSVCGALWQSSSFPPRIIPGSAIPFPPL